MYLPSVPTRRGGGGGPRTNNCGLSSERGPGGTTMLHMFLSLSAVSLFVNCTNYTFRPSPCHSATESQSFRFNVRLLADPPLLGGPKFFSPRPVPALRGHGYSGDKDWFYILQGSILEKIIMTASGPCSYIWVRNIAVQKKEQVLFLNWQSCYREPISVLYFVIPTRFNTLKSVLRDSEHNNFSKRLRVWLKTRHSSLFH
jgi:hypothetical protein